MKINFIYNEDEDIKCLLTLGIGETHEPGQTTPAYQKLVAFTKETDNAEKVREFVRKYISENRIDLKRTKERLQQNWEAIAAEFERRAENIFGIKIRYSINAYMTITGRYPYYPFDEDKRFYVPADRENSNPVVMHELWHFYTWYKFGHAKQADEEKFSMAAEALTVLLNIECADFMQVIVDDRYPQYRRIREIIAGEWARSRDINKIWRVSRSYFNRIG